MREAKALVHRISILFDATVIFLLSFIKLLVILVLKLVFIFHLVDRTIFSFKHFIFMFLSNTDILFQLYTKKYIYFLIGLVNNNIGQREHKSMNNLG